MTKTGERGPIPQPWICSAEVGGGGNAVMRLGTQQPRELGKWKLFHLENGLYRVQYGVFPTKFGHKLLLSLSALLDNV